jgi:hypothetical protein
MKKSVSLFSIILIFFLLTSPASAEDDTRISVQFQSLSLTTQDYIVFDDSGDDVFHSNTSSTITLDWNESKFYTIQMQPSVTNVEPTIWYQNVLNFILDNYIALFLIIALIVVITRKW